MNKLKHSIYIGLMVLITISVLAILIFEGYDYYQTALESRFYHADHDSLKSSGILGHGYGIIGSFLMLFGVGSYMLRKRLKVFSKTGQIKYWLEFHIFLCTVGPILVLFHTAMKFGGIVSISFWSMVAVFASGIIGRFIYVQIPRTIEGRELSLAELQSSKLDAAEILKSQIEFSESFLQLISGAIDATHDHNKETLSFEYFAKSKRDKNNIKKIKEGLKLYELNKAQKATILDKVKNEIRINRRIDRLNYMKNLFRYWHVAHLPFAVIMLVIMIIHVIVTLLFGYKWIF